jgi:hypothetical protein
VVWSVGVCAARRVVENSPLAGENRDDEDGDDAVRSLQEAGGEAGVEVVAHVLPSSVAFKSIGCQAECLDLVREGPYSGGNDYRRPDLGSRPFLCGDQACALVGDPFFPPPPAS